MSYPASLTVLVADPDRAQQQIVAECLRSRYQVVAARSIAETVDVIARSRPQILLLELDMPDGDALPLVRKIREERSTQHMIIACVTRRSAIRDKVTGFQAGADDYIVKPINPETFLWRVVLLSRLRQLTY
ncbi:MAG: response regulator transcription factor [Ktedonobacterales bacterium]|nr:response regulator transcription factor [Ktedonobacterales bacterium]